MGMPLEGNHHRAAHNPPHSSSYTHQVADGTVLMEFRKGFKIGDKLLRPAMVKVSVAEDAPVSTMEE